MDEPDIEVRTYFARGRNALVARGDFSGLFAAWYLHRMDHQQVVPTAMEALARAALAAMTLHCAGRPWQEACAWTVKFPEPRANIFVAGDNNSGTVIAHLVADDQKPITSGVFHADVVEGRQAPRRSVVDFQTSSFLEAVEIFYAQSEQRIVRFFWHGDENLVMVAAQPDCDLEWLKELTVEGVRRLDKDVELALLEKRSFTFQCGCNHERILDVIAPVFERESDGFFQNAPSVTILCPRCGARHVLTREEIEERLGHSRKMRL